MQAPASRRVAHEASYSKPLSARKILGIDPGSRCTGYGVITVMGAKFTHVAHGRIISRDADISLRLHHIFTELSQVIATYQPTEAAIERVFIAKNPQSALKLGEARGAALTAAATYALPVAEYMPRAIKQAVVGFGAASKLQIAHMVRALLHVSQPVPEDAADALAIAICHANSRPG